MGRRDTVLPLREVCRIEIEVNCSVGLKHTRLRHEERILPGSPLELVVRIVHIARREACCILEICDAVLRIGVVRVDMESVDCRDRHSSVERDLDLAVDNFKLDVIASK